MLTIFLARHATPDWECKNLPYHIPPGPPLTDQGLREAQELGAFLEEAGVRYFYSSPLERCLHTAKIAAAMSGVPYEIDPGLMEVQPGESKSSLRDRLCPIFTQASQYGLVHGPVVLVTHGGPITVLLSELGLDESTLKRQSTFDHHNPLPPAGVWQATQPAPGQPWKLRLAFLPEPVVV